jgi:ADP-ribose pyrophosphatase YjhB (NUDIX family)
MSKRENTGYMDGCYSLPAGHVEEGEAFTQAAIRGALEELGVVILPGDLKVALVMQRRTSESKNNQRIDVFFVVNRWSGEPRNLEPHKCGDLRWSNLIELPLETVPYIRSALLLIQENVFYSDEGWVLPP